MLPGCPWRLSSRSQPRWSPAQEAWNAWILLEGSLSSPFWASRTSLMSVSNVDRGCSPPTESSWPTSKDGFCKFLNLVLTLDIKWSLVAIKIIFSYFDLTPLWIQHQTLTFLRWIFKKCINVCCDKICGGNVQFDSIMTSGNVPGSSFYPQKAFFSSILPKGLQNYTKLAT